MNFKIGPQSESDNDFVAHFRLHQSEYRARILKEDYGFGPTKNSKNRFGNILVLGEKTGSNFISEAAFRFAKQKVLDKQINKYLTIDEYRLFNNMLSSMPMCFNMFSDLREMLVTEKDNALKIVKELFIEIPWIHELTYVDVEFIPIPITDYTNDKSAFDALLLVKDDAGKAGLISIETKYTDILGENRASDSDIKNDLVKKGKFFKQALCDELMQNGYKQIHRNFLLTYAYAKKNRFKYFANVILSPKSDILSEKEIQEMKSEMTKHQECVYKLSLEKFVDRGKNCSHVYFKNLMQKFEIRYLK